MLIDKVRLREYINIKHADSIHVVSIKSININKMRYFRDQIDVDSRYSEIVANDGSVVILMIRVDWYGWKVVTEKLSKSRPELIGTWAN